MTEPTTVNGGLIVPNTGDLVGTWGSAALNPDFVAIDGTLWGVQIIGASSVPIVLTSPSGFTPTPGGGPTQAQNAVLRFTGALSAPVQVTLPIPGFYIIENLTTGNFVLSFRAIGSGAVIAIDQGEIIHIENDGTNVKFANFGRVGHIEIWAGLSAIPAWVTACTNAPYLLCDGAVYNFSAFPYLGARLGSSFGGNGSTTFGVPDLRGRYPLIYDGTGTRITTANSGINGQAIGAAGGSPDPTLAANNVPNGVGVSVSGTVTVNVSGNVPTTSGSWSNRDTTATGGDLYPAPSSAVGNASSFSGSNTLGGTTTGNPSPTPLITIPPTQVSGIAVIRAA